MGSIFKIFFTAPGSRPFFVLGCLLCANIFEGLSIGTLLPALGELSNSGGGSDNAFSSFIRDFFSYFSIPFHLTSLIIFLSAGFLLKSVMLFIALTYVGYSISHVTTNNRLRLFDGLIQARWSYFLSHDAGDLTNSIGYDAMRAGAAYQLSGKCIAMLAQCMMYVIVAIIISPRLALISLCVGVSFFLILGRFVKISQRAGRKQAVRMAGLTSILTEILGNIKSIKSMGRHGSLVLLFKKQAHSLRRALFRDYLATQCRERIQEVLIYISIGITFYVAGSVWRIALDEMVVLGIIYYQIISLMGRFQRQLQATVVNTGSWDRLNRFIRLTDDAHEGSGGDVVPDLREGLSLDGVSFSYGGKEGYVFKDVNMVIPAQEITVIEGPSGSGKTTLVDLFLGFHRPFAGRVMIDGIDLSEIDLTAWRSMIGYVPQELSALNDTVMNNITLGDPRFSEDDVWDVLREVHIYDFISRLSDGLETRMGHMGVRFSGGQRQRIALARALISRPRLLILDEITSAMDDVTESVIISNISLLGGVRTILCITHRRSWRDIADCVYRVDSQSVRFIRGRSVIGSPAAARVSGG